MAPYFVFAALAWASLGLCAVLEETPVLPKGWRQLQKRPSETDQLRLSIALRHPNIDDMNAHIASRSHISQSEARALRTPDQQDVDAVLKWLSNSGITDATAKGDWIHVHTTVGEAEPLLNMELARFAYEDKASVLRTRRYSIPDSLTHAIRFVHPISNFMSFKNDLSSPSPPLSARALGPQDSFCLRQTTPDCIRQRYNITYTADAPSSIRFGVAGFLDEFANYKDAGLFLQRMAPSVAAKGYNFTVELVNGGENSQEPALSGTEAALDVDYALALGYPTKITYYSTGGRGPQLNESGKAVPVEFVDNEPYIELLEYLLDLSDSEFPHVLSISYADDELSVPRPYAERVCQLFGLLTARGTSILSGSGDGGARGGRDSNCRTNDGTDRDVAMSTFPASCPWITAVGAVTNADSPLTGASFSSGGFSQYFPRERWQDAAVGGYVKELNGHLDGYYNASMRAVPDISAIGTSFLTIVGGKPTYLQGTSASTPVLAAMFALINDARVRQSKPVLGWLNGLLYSDPVRAVLQDVAAGDSLPCQFRNSTPGGWPAKAGYDTITGLGVPGDFQELLKVLLDV